MPIAPLMLEHRLIERMIKAMKLDIQRIDRTGKVEPGFIDLAIDFIKTYADRCHHGKEENILFHLLSEKNMSQPDKRTMGELSDDHERLRSIANRLIEARNRFGGSGNAGAGKIRSIMHELVTFYPVHIEKEDKHFFIPCMEYLTAHEQDDMFEAFAEFDRKVIHDKYRAVVERIEGRRKGPGHAGED